MFAASPAWLQASSSIFVFGSGKVAINFRVAVGEALGVVGSTGCGKSTFVDLLLGLLDPVDGTITIDGKPLPENMREWRAHRYLGGWGGGT